MYMRKLFVVLRGRSWRVTRPSAGDLSRCEVVLAVGLDNGLDCPQAGSCLEQRRRQSRHINLILRIVGEWNTLRNVVYVMF
jgi:hypothetical protein